MKWYIHNPYWVKGLGFIPTKIFKIQNLTISQWKSFNFKEQTLNIASIWKKNERILLVMIQNYYRIFFSKSVLFSLQCSSRKRQKKAHPTSYIVACAKVRISKKNDLLSNYYNFPSQEKNDNLHDIAYIQSNNKQIQILYLWYF